MERQVNKLLHNKTIQTLLLSNDIKQFYPTLKNSDFSQLNQLDVALLLGAGAIGHNEVSVLKVAVNYLLSQAESEEFKANPLYRQFVTLYLDKTAKDIKRSLLWNSLFLIGIHLLVYITFRDQITALQIGLLIGALILLLVLNFFFVLRRYSMKNLNKEQVAPILKIWK